MTHRLLARLCGEVCVFHRGCGRSRNGFLAAQQAAQLSPLWQVASDISSHLVVLWRGKVYVDVCFDDGDGFRWFALQGRSREQN